MRKIHELKTVQPYFESVKSGKKNFEYRLNDRDYKVGDRLDLMEYDMSTGFSGDHLHKVVTYIYPLSDNMVIMSLDIAED